KDTKTDGKLVKVRNSKRIANRILPGPLSGIYRNGAVSKEIRRSQVGPPSDDINNARLEGNVMKLLQGYNPNSKGVVIDNNNEEQSTHPLLDSTARNILYPTPADLSPVLGKVDGKKRHPTNECQRNDGPLQYLGVSQPVPEKKKPINTESPQYSAVKRYEEFCAMISKENFEGPNFPNMFTKDPLVTVKEKLRSIYAESFRSQFLRDLIKRGKILNERSTTSSFVRENLPEAIFCPSSYGRDTDLATVTTEYSDSQVRCRKAKESSSQGTKNLFLLPHRSGMERVESELESNVQNVDLDTDDFSDSSKQDRSLLEVDPPLCHKRNIKYFETILPSQTNNADRPKGGNRSMLFVASDGQTPKDLDNKKHLTKRKNQRTQTVHILNSGVKRHPGKYKVKTSQQIKMKNLKHIPAILRRCHNHVVSNNDMVNLFDESMLVNKPKEILFGPSKRKVLFTPQSVVTESENLGDTVLDTDPGDLDVHTCVIASPSLRNDELRFARNSQMQTDQQVRINIDNIFSKKNKKNGPVQKTVMFTKKVTHNTSHSQHPNSLTADRQVENSVVCSMRKNIPQQQDKCLKNVCTAHRNCQRVSANCHRSFHCSQKSDESSYGSQEFKEVSLSQVQPVQVQQESVVCDKVLLRKVQQHPSCENDQHCHGNNQRVCFVVVDQCKDLNGSQDRSNDNVAPQMKKRMLENGVFCQEDVADIGILKGVQNLQILPVEKREPRINFTSNRCTGNTVVVEEQPIKYLAFENDSKAQKIPIYMQNKKQPQFTSVDNVDLVSSRVNYRLVSCPEESTQQILLVPTREQNNVVYVKENSLNHSNVAFERMSHPRKMFFYRSEDQSSIQRVKDSGNVCEVHAPKQNLVEIRSTDYETIANLQQLDNGKRSRKSFVNCEGLHYRPEHTIVNDACARSQPVYYQK
ncbi:hypothetical protein WN55_04053, partial [Dufourea novaeangliae]